MKGGGWGCAAGKSHCPHVNETKGLFLTNLTSLLWAFAGRRAWTIKGPPKYHPFPYSMWLSKRYPYWLWEDDINKKQGYQGDNIDHIWTIRGEWCHRGPVLINLENGNYFVLAFSSHWLQWGLDSEPPQTKSRCVQLFRSPQTAREGIGDMTCSKSDTFGHPSVMWTLHPGSAGCT